MNVKNRFLQPLTAFLRKITFSPVVGVLAIGMLLAACTQGEPAKPAVSDQASQNQGGIFGNGGLFGNDPYAGGRAIGVNSFLWRASLDTISFMPVKSADPFGGVIITDWYSAGDSPNERFKLDVYILGRSLRADGVRVAVFRQVQVSPGNWQDRTLADTTAVKIEDAILTRARQLRNAQQRSQ